MYHKDADTDTARIVGFEVSPGRCVVRFDFTCSKLTSFACVELPFRDLSRSFCETEK